MMYLKRWLVVLVLLVISACQSNPRTENLAVTGTQGPGAAMLTIASPASTPDSSPILTATQTLAPTILPSELPAPPTTGVPVVTATPPRITLLFTGVIVPARCVQAAIDARGDAEYIYDEVRGLIQGADLAVASKSLPVPMSAGLSS